MSGQVSSKYVANAMPCRKDKDQVRQKFLHCGLEKDGVVSRDVVYALQKC